MSYDEYNNAVLGHKRGGILLKEQNAIIAYDCMAEESRLPAVSLVS